jgi:hypothetical protein
MSDLIRLVEVYSLYTAKDKIITREVTTNYGCETDAALAVLVEVTKDFDPSKKTDKILYDTASYQIRPKTLYKSKVGIFFKDEEGRRYLTLQEKIDLRIENEQLGKFLFA